MKHDIYMTDISVNVRMEEGPFIFRTFLTKGNEVEAKGSIFPYTNNTVYDPYWVNAINYTKIVKAGKAALDGTDLKFNNWEVDIVCNNNIYFLGEFGNEIETGTLFIIAVANFLKTKNEIFMLPSLEGCRNCLAEIYNILKATH